MRSEFTFVGVPQGNFRLDGSLGGGALLDVGPYVARPLVAWDDSAWAVDELIREVNVLGQISARGGT